MAAHTAELPHCVMLGLGGSLDVYAGEVRRAPGFSANAGLSGSTGSCASRNALSA